MTERFYNIKHLTTAQLRELYLTYRKHGWVEFEFYRLMPKYIKRPKLSDTEVLLNIDANDENNYFTFMIDYPDEEDGVMIGLGMCEHDFAAYLHLPPEFLDELIEKYALQEVNLDGVCFTSLTKFLVHDMKFDKN